MNFSTSRRPNPVWMQAQRAHRLLVVTLLGFASGLPLALTGQAMHAWLTQDGLKPSDIGFLSLVGLPYTFKFLWAPLMDRFELPGLGRRRGWLVLTQLLLAVALWWMSMTSPSASTRAFALLAVLVAFVSASQDIVIDAYRTDLLSAKERGPGASLSVLGFRLAMIVSGGFAMIWADPQQGAGWSWPQVYQLMAMLMIGAAVVSALALPKVVQSFRPVSRAENDLRGFLAVAVAIAVGYVLTAGLGGLVRPEGVATLPWWRELLASGVFRPLSAAALEPWLLKTSLNSEMRGKWIDLLTLLIGIGVTFPLASWAARRAKFETLINGLGSYFSQKGAVAFLAFIVLYKLGDAFAGSLMTPFLLKSMTFTQAELGVANKVIGMWLTIGGALIGGALMFKLGLWRSLMAFGVLQMVSNLGFWWLAVNGKGVLPPLVVPAFDWGIVSLAQATPVDGGLLMVIAFENLSGGMGTAAFVAFLMSLCNHRFSATQYALLSAFASVGRVWVGPLAGVLAETIGWPVFFLVSTVAAVPALVLLVYLYRPVNALGLDPDTPLPDDD